GPNHRHALLRWAYSTSALGYMVSWVVPTIARVRNRPPPANDMAFPPDPPTARQAAPLRPLPNLIFTSRWLQLPLYLGLIVAQGVYVFHFLVELTHLVQAAFGSEAALDALVKGMGYSFQPGETPKLTETVIMLAVLALIDVVMISNLLIMV